MIANDRDFTTVKNSPIQGNGLFAKKLIPKGTRILEYEGERVLKSNLISDIATGLTSGIYVMNLNETTVIDAERNGNNARFANHSCDPNCEIMFFNKTPYLYAMENIPEGIELNFDYKLGFGDEVEMSNEDKKEWFPCKCGTANCRGTLLVN